MFKIRMSKFAFLIICITPIGCKTVWKREITGEISTTMVETEKRTNSGNVSAKVQFKLSQ